MAPTAKAQAMEVEAHWLVEEKLAVVRWRAMLEDEARQGQGGAACRKVEEDSRLHVTTAQCGGSSMMWTLLAYNHIHLATIPRYKTAKTPPAATSPQPWPISTSRSLRDPPPLAMKQQERSSPPLPPKYAGQHGEQQKVNSNARAMPPVYKFSAHSTNRP